MRTLMIALAISLCYFFMGCASEPSGVQVEGKPCIVDEDDYESIDDICGGEFTIVGNFTPRELRNIVVAMDRMNKFFGRKQMVLTKDGCSILKMDANTKYVGMYYQSNGRLELATDYKSMSDDEYMQLVVIHEMMHSAGFNHRHSGMMCSTTDGSLDFTEEDVAQCQELGLCSTKPL